MSLGDPAPMRRDAIFRIASLTKPITAVAAMMLVEECNLRLDESIEAWLPELANRRVLKFMLLNTGRHGREHLLSRATVELMTSDQLTPAQRTGGEAFFGAHCSWGFGMAVDVQRREIFHSPGRFGWDGGLDTSAYTDPAEGMIGILFTQRMMDSPEPPKIFTDFWTLAYGAMV
jgi:CubicO group peptidase (beta-lactamase class C family)